MGNSNASGKNVDIKAAEPAEAACPVDKKLKACCACPETKKPRDECVLMKGEENCLELIEAHKICMRAHGFKI